MYSVYGRPRVLSAVKVAAAHEWHRRRKTARQMANELGISVHTLLASVRRPDLQPETPNRGRKRKLRGWALRKARTWYADRRTRAQRARELDMTLGQFNQAVYRIRKGYKAAPPERHADAVRQRRALLKRLEALALV
jgi:hypothetical protein